jgi:hypothetical protein
MQQRFVIKDSASASQAAIGLGLIANSIVKDVDLAMKPALDQFGKDVLNVTTPYVPMKTGALRNSAKFFTTKAGSYLWQLLVSYGGVAPSFPQIIDDMEVMGTEPKGEVTYAVERHEVPAKVYSTPGTGIKYLEFGGFKSIPLALIQFRSFITARMSKFRIN